MISVLYDLIYMIPVGVAAVYAAESYAGLSAPGPAGYMVMMLTVGIGEVISCGVLGLLLYYAVRGHKEEIFRV